MKKKNLRKIGMVIGVAATAVVAGKLIKVCYDAMQLNMDSKNETLDLILQADGNINSQIIDQIRSLSKSSRLLLSKALATQEIKEQINDVKLLEILSLIHVCNLADKND